MKNIFNKIFKKIERTPSLEEITSKISNENKTILSTYVNPYSIQLLDENIINKIDNIYVDGITLVWLLNFTYGFKIKRSSFDLTSHADELFSSSYISNYKVGLIGGTKKEIEDTVTFFSERYPELNIDFYHSGYFEDDDLKHLISKFKNCDFIICGMGTPKQEEFMIFLKHTFPYGKRIFSCGAFFSQTSSKGDYYHPLVDKLNLRWVQRHIESSEVRRRHIIEYPKFLYKFIKNLFS